MWSVLHLLIYSLDRIRHFVWAVHTDGHYEWQREVSLHGLWTQRIAKWDAHVENQNILMQYMTEWNVYKKYFGYFSLSKEKRDFKDEVKLDQLPCDGEDLRGRKFPLK